MKSNTDNLLKDLPTNELWQHFNSAESILLYESYGSDHDARYEQQNRVRQLYNELERRGALPSQQPQQQRKSDPKPKSNLARFLDGEE